MTLLSAALLLVALFVLFLVRRPEQIKVITVIDGDTCVVTDKSGKRYKVRIYGVDAPEVGQPGSEQATQFLKDELLGRWSTARWYGYDRYKRRLGRIKGRTQDVSVGLLRHGLAYPTGRAGMSWHSLGPRFLRSGVWGAGARPHQSLKRRVRAIGWLSWKLQKIRRAHAKRR